MPLTERQAADRVLAVLCRMTNGDTARSVAKADLIAECDRLKVLEMSEDEFRTYLLSDEKREKGE